MLRRSWTLSFVAMSTPSMRIWPDVGSIMRLIMRRSVVLPHPEDPTRTVAWWAGRTKLKSSTATVPSGNCLVTDRNSIIVASSFLGLAGGAASWDVSWGRSCRRGDSTIEPPLRVTGYVGGGVRDPVVVAVAPTARPPIDTRGRVSVY